MAVTDLTDREVEVVFWVANGKEPSEIAVILGISRQRVNNVLYEVRGKLQAQTTAHAVAIALRREYIKLDQIYDGDNDKDNRLWYQRVSKFLIVLVLMASSIPFNDKSVRFRVRTRRREDSIEWMLPGLQ